MANTALAPTLSDYADTIIKEKNFTTLTPETYKQIKDDVLTRLNDFLMAKLLNKLNDTQMAEFNKLMAKNPKDEEIQDFLSANIPELSVAIGDILLSFRKIYLGLE